MRIYKGECQTETSEAAYNRMWHVINERRADTTTVKVSVEDLKALLNDHRTFCQVIKTNGG